MTCKKKILIMKYFVGFVLFVVMASCITVKEYQKVYINDPAMELSASPDQRFETNFQVYREGAAGANGGKTGGGCGCN
jgi:hypothetical protein